MKKEDSLLASDRGFGVSNLNAEPQFGSEDEAARQQEASTQPKAVKPPPTSKSFPAPRHYTSATQEPYDPLEDAGIHAINGRY